MSCEEAFRHFFAYLDGALEGASLESLEKHVHECVHCCGQLEFSRRLDRMVMRSLPDVELPEGLEARIRRAVNP